MDEQFQKNIRLNEIQQQAQYWRLAKGFIFIIIDIIFTIIIVGIYELDKKKYWWQYIFITLSAIIFFYSLYLIFFEISLIIEKKIRNNKEGGDTITSDYLQFKHPYLYLMLSGRWYHKIIYAFICTTIFFIGIFGFILSGASIGGYLHHEYLLASVVLFLGMAILIFSFWQLRTFNKFYYKFKFLHSYNNDNILIKKIQITNNYYIKSLFIIVFLLSIFFLIKEVLESISTFFLYGLVINFMFTNYGGKLDDEAILRKFFSEISQFANSSTANEFQILLIRVSIFFTLSLLFFIFINSRNKILKNTDSLENIQIEELQEIEDKINGLLKLNNLVIRYNYNENDIKSFSSLFRKYLILGNSSLKINSKDFPFQLNHEYNHLKNYDSLFVSFFLGSYTVLFLLIPFFDFKRFAIYYFMIEVKKYYLLIFGFLLSIGKILITFYFYKKFIIEFIYFREYEADNYAHTQSNVIPEFNSSNWSEYHPSPDLRVRNLKERKYFIDFLPIYFLIIFNLNFIPSHIESIYAWILVCLLSILIIADKYYFRMFYINKLSLVIILCYHLLRVFDRLPLFIQPLFDFLFKTFNKTPQDIFTVSQHFKTYGIDIIIFILLTLSIVLFGGETWKNFKR